MRGSLWTTLAGRMGNMMDEMCKIKLFFTLSPTNYPHFDHKGLI